MSGLLRPNVLPVTELFLGFVVSPKKGSVDTTTPPEILVGPEGTLPERWLAVTSMPLAPRSAIPIPENAPLPNVCWARHERVLFSTVLPATLNSPTGSALKASKNIPAQLLCTWFPTTEPLWVSPKNMPHTPPEMLLPTTFASWDFWPATNVPMMPKRLITLERILVPGESTMYTPS